MVHFDIILYKSLHYTEGLFSLITVWKHRFSTQVWKGHLFNGRNIKN